MKLIQLDFEKRCVKPVTVVVEVPDDYAEDDLSQLITQQQILTIYDEEGGSEVYDSDDAATLTSQREITSDEGDPHFRLAGQTLVRVQARG